uniref:C-type lectin domain-containing protein n=1 Tax=Neogobius melanostomus TaxID=47308 RepID=A0A8C6SYP2_9GOBI
MSMEYTNFSEANMDIDDSKIAHRSLLMDTNKLRFSVYTFKQNPYRVATVCLGVFCVLLVVGLIGQSVSYRRVQEESTNKLQNVNADKDGLQKSLSSVQKEKSKIEQRQRELEQNVDRLSRRKEQVQNAYNTLAEEMNKARESESALKSSKAALTQELQQLNATTNKLQSDNAALLMARDLFEVELKQAVQLKTNLEKSYKTLTAEKNILQNSFNNVSRVKDQLHLSYSNLMMEIETLEKQLHITTNEKDQAQTGHIDAKTATDSLQVMYDLLVKGMEQMNSSYNELLREKQEQEKSCGLTRAEKDSLMEMNGNLTAERDQLQLEITKLNATIAAKRCPSGWRSYMYSCYYTSATKKNWKNSRDNCKNKGADLAIITSQEEMNFINGLYSSDKEVWIGLTDESAEGRFHWVDGTPLNPNATFWGSGQPNSYEGRNQDCVEFWHRAKGNGEWNDESCKIEQYWICEL